MTILKLEIWPDALFLVAFLPRIIDVFPVILRAVEVVEPIELPFT